MLKFSCWFQDCQFIFLSRFIISPQSNVNANLSAPIWFYVCVCVPEIWGFSKAKRAITFRHLSVGIRFRFKTIFFWVNFYIMCLRLFLCATMNSKNYRIRVGKLWIQMSCLDLEFIGDLCKHVRLCVEFSVLCHRKMFCRWNIYWRMWQQPLHHEHKQSTIRQTDSALLQFSLVFLHNEIYTYIFSIK